jgi:A/G-specific adenine glycosylase
MKCALEKWYLENARKLPWRDTSDPYLIWVSEIILQQTRVEQGTPFYYNFITKFPTIESLATASEDDVLKVWQGLGYYSRARNMIKAARVIVETHNSKFPKTIDELKRIPGIGSYTAAAVGSFAFNVRMPAIDGNVRRVASRLYGLHDPIGTPKSDARIEQRLLREMLPCEPALFNQAMIEIGAMVCKPLNPNCEECPLNKTCLSYKHDLQKILPVKPVKKAPKQVFLDYIFLNCEGNTWIQKRPNNAIWKGLYEFPNIQQNTESRVKNPFESWFLNEEETELKPMIQFKHQLTHQTIFATLWQFSCKEANIVKANIKGKFKVKISDLQEFPVHKLMYRFITEVI